MEIRVESLNKTFRGVQVLEDINYTFTSGKIYGLAGKTAVERPCCFGRSLD